LFCDQFAINVSFGTFEAIPSQLLFDEPCFVLSLIL